MLIGVDAVHVVRDERVLARCLDGLTGFAKYNWMKDRHEAQARQRRRAHARAVKVVDQSCTEGNCMEDVTGMGVDGAPVLVDTTTGKMAPLPRTDSTSRARRGAFTKRITTPEILGIGRGGGDPATGARR